MPKATRQKSSNLSSAPPVVKTYKGKRSIAPSKPSKTSKTSARSKSDASKPKFLAPGIPYELSDGEELPENIIGPEGLNLKPNDAVANQHEHQDISALQPKQIQDLLATYVAKIKELEGERLLFKVEEELLLSCDICLEWNTDPVVTECGHTFCKPCIQGVKEQFKKLGGPPGFLCPMCRQLVLNVFPCLRLKDRAVIASGRSLLRK